MFTFGAITSGNRLSRSAIFNLLVVMFMFWICVAPAAQAYLDPGTGSFILQTLIAALFGAIFVLKSYWVRIKSWFSGSSNISEDSEEEVASKKSFAGDSLANPELPEGSGGQIVDAETRKKADAKSDEQ